MWKSVTSLDSWIMEIYKVHKNLFRCRVFMYGKLEFLKLEKHLWDVLTDVGRGKKIWKANN